jgi:hypothetical protein
VQEALGKEVAGQGIKVETPAKVVEGKDGEYPECEKMSAVGTEHNALMEFAEWLEDKGITLAHPHTHGESCYIDHDHKFADGANCSVMGECRVTRDKICGYQKDELALVYCKFEDMVMDFLGIDQKKLDEERRAMLEKMRADA